MPRAFSPGHAAGQNADQSYHFPARTLIPEGFQYGGDGLALIPPTHDLH